MPCYRRPEYSQKCIESIEKAQEYPDTLFYLIDDCSNDTTIDILSNSTLNKVLTVNHENKGLRRNLIDFFKFSKGFKYVFKVDNDCLVPKNWLNDLKSVLDEGNVDILSPNVFPSDAAHKYGKQVEELNYMPSKIVGGLWAMKTDLYKDINFESIDTYGIKGAFNLLNQIIIEKEARVGWLPSVIFQDMGHHSGNHPEHIKSEEHLNYSIEVGRSVSWI